MKKCPRCNHEINDQDRFCPHCGFDLQRKYFDMNKKKRFSFMPFLVLLLVFSIIPVAFSTVLDLVGNESMISDKEESLKAIKDHEPRQRVARFYTLADFKHRYTNVDSMIEGIESYEKELHEKRNDIFEKEYLIDVFDNNDVHFKLVYTTKIDDLYDLKIERTFDRQKTQDHTELRFVKKDAHSFEDLLLNEQDQKVLYAYVDNHTKIERAMQDFKALKNEFEVEKDQIGHYGMGVYHDDVSMVIKRYNDEYRNEVIYRK